MEGPRECEPYDPVVKEEDTGTVGGARAWWDGDTAAKGRGGGTAVVAAWLSAISPRDSGRAMHGGRGDRGGSSAAVRVVRVPTSTIISSIVIKPDPVGRTENSVTRLRNRFGFKINPTIFKI